MLCMGPARRFLFCQECFYSWAWRWDSHFHSNNCVQWGWPGAYGVQDQWSSGERIILLSPSASVSLDCSRALCIQVLPGESWSPRSANTGLQSHRRNTLQPETARTSKTRDNQMAKGKCKNLSNRKQDYLVPSEPCSPTTASYGFPNTLEKQDVDLKSYLMMLIEEHK